MKKIILTLIAGITLFAALINGLYAQHSAKAVESTDEKNFMPSIRKLAMEDSALTGNYIGNTNYVNIWAIRDFQDRYSKSEHTMWFSAPHGGFVSYFIQDGYGNRVIYDEKGRWQFSLITYGEDKLPGNIRAEIRFTYIDLDITLVEEVQTMEGIEYIVYLEDKSNILIVKVNSEGEMEVLRELKK